MFHKQDSYKKKTKDVTNMVRSKRERETLRERWNKVAGCYKEGEKKKQSYFDSIYMRESVILCCSDCKKMGQNDTVCLYQSWFFCLFITQIIQCLVDLP